jgi:RND family efflux transporter MFP subunit
MKTMPTTPDIGDSASPLEHAWVAQTRFARMWSRPTAGSSPEWNSRFRRGSTELGVSSALGILTVLAALSAAACSRPARAMPEASPAALAFSLATPSVGDAIHERQHVAEIRAARRVEIRSRLNGFIESVAVDEGRAVNAGQVLFTIDTRELKQRMLGARAATSAAQAELRSAEIERESTRLLFDAKVVSAAELALADANVQTLQAKLQEASATQGQVAIDLSHSEVRAPFAGVVNRIPLRAGSAIAEGEPLTTLTNSSEVFAYFRLSEAEYLEYTAAGSAPREAWLRLADGSNYPETGTIDAIESEFDAETGNIAFRARFGNAGGRLKHGSGGLVVLRTTLPGALMVPQKATFEIQEQLYVYVVDAENTARARRIIPKLRLGESFVIEAGLEQSERIVLEGVQQVRDGSKVQALPAETPSDRS